MMLSVTLLFSLACLRYGQTVDMTLRINATGADVVRAVQSKLNESDLFSAPTSAERQVYEMFIRQAAYVESLDGAESHDGGIWRVSRSIFLQTQQVNSTLLDGICLAFCINWMAVQYSQLNIPLYSGIAINIYLHYLYSQRLRVTDSDTDRAIFWVQSFGKLSGSEDRWSSRIVQLRANEGNLKTAVHVATLTACTCMFNVCEPVSCRGGAPTKI